MPSFALRIKTKQSSNVVCKVLLLSTSPQLLAMSLPPTCAPAFLDFVRSLSRFLLLPGNLSVLFFIQVIFTILQISTQTSVFKLTDIPQKVRNHLMQDLRNYHICDENYLCQYLLCFFLDYRFLKAGSVSICFIHHLYLQNSRTVSAID